MAVARRECGNIAFSTLYFSTCNQDLACAVAALPAFFAQTEAGADQILTALQSASPSSQIIVLQEFNPYMLALPASIAPFQQMNAILASVAAAHGATLADGVTPFTAANLCTLTFERVPPLNDIHPTDAGYLVPALAVGKVYFHHQARTAAPNDGFIPPHGWIRVAGGCHADHESAYTVRTNQSNGGAIVSCLGMTALLPTRGVPVWV